MEDLLNKIKKLVELGEVKISEHGYDQLSEDGLHVKDIITGIKDAITVEVYMEYHKGPCVLVLQKSIDGSFIHVLWGIPIETEHPAVLITAYRPDPARWSTDFLRRIR